VISAGGVERDEENVCVVEIFVRDRPRAGCEQQRENEEAGSRFEVRRKR
jgi:hypothetical protein